MIKDDFNELDKALDLAFQVQRLLFPPSSPLCTWCCTGVKNRMARKVGGDYFDFITMPDQCQSLFIGDVTGHGFHAAVIMSLIYGYIHRSTLGECAPKEIVDGVNKFLCTFARRTQKFDYYFSTTLFFAIIDPNSLKMHYVNCGHTPPLAKQGGKIISLPTSGPPLGFFDDPDIDVLEFKFKPGDRLLLCTDGIIEAKNRQGEMYGMQRLRGDLQHGAGDHIEFLDELFGQLDKFCSGQVNEDDMTAILLDFNRPFSSY
ncbi:PP2C family protein-serine/threonine phosphatase [Malonomonas rubra]|uniref:PP2C family protein-serine/threonine phosphatase n=1 Tax=Malonomonas rubra TaxID=57040 RepID=UPI0026EA4CCA|nr:PP2C family protein-serine/threonine phosphatase [Malonomonas rubra]